MYKQFAQGATTLPQEYFLSEEFFAYESDKIFSRKWLCAGRSSNLPQTGSYLMEPVGESIILTPSLTGELIGAPNMKDVPGFDRSAHPLHSIAKLKPGIGTQLFDQFKIALKHR